MFIKTISEKTKKNLEILSKAQFMQDFYITGGTGLALQLGHRVSLDVDFFTQKKFINETLKNIISSIGKFTVTYEAENTLSGIFNNTKISFFWYKYSMLFKLKKFLNLNLAHTLDIACTKIDTISSRGEKKDFIDLYFVCKKVKPLKQILILFRDKYKGINYSEMYILKSFTYFENADKNPMPKMLLKADWDEIKNFFRKETKKLTNSLLNPYL